MTKSNKSEVVIHVVDALDAPSRDELTDGLEKNEDIYSAEFCPSRYHLMLVEYDKHHTNSQQVLHQVTRQKITASLVGPI